MPDLTHLLREAADALWLIPQHAGLAQRLQNAAESMSTPPLPSAEPMAWGVWSRERSAVIRTWCGVDAEREARRVARIVNDGEWGKVEAVPLYTTPPAAAQDTGRLAMARLITATEDALMVGLDEGTNNYSVEEVRERETNLRNALDAARAAGGE